MNTREDMHLKECVCVCVCTLGGQHGKHDLKGLKMCKSTTGSTMQSQSFINQV